MNRMLFLTILFAALIHIDFAEWQGINPNVRYNPRDISAVLPEKLSIRERLHEFLSNKGPLAATVERSLSTPATLPTLRPTSVPTYLPKYPTPAPTRNGAVISQYPTSAHPTPGVGKPTLNPTAAATPKPSNIPGTTTPPGQIPTGIPGAPTRSPTPKFTHWPTAVPTPVPSKYPAKSCAPASSSTVAAPKVIQSIVPKGYWIRNIFTIDGGGNCQGTPDMQTSQALGQCYIISKTLCGKTTYESYNYISKTQKTMGGFETIAIYKAQYTDANCKSPYSTYPVALIVPDQCEDTTDENMSAFQGGKTNFATSYFVGNVLSTSKTGPPATINGVQTTYYATNTDCASNTMYSFMSVVGLNYCIQLSTTTSQSFECDGIMSTTLYIDDITCSTQGYKDEHFNLLRTAQCSQLSADGASASDSAAYYVSNRCITNITPSPTIAPVPYMPGSQTTAPSAKPGSPSVSGYWVTRNYTSKTCGGDAYVQDYITLGLCNILGDEDVNQPVTAKYGMIDFVQDSIGVTLWQFYFSDKDCIQRIQGFPIETIRNFKSGRCTYYPNTKTSGSVSFLQGTTPPTSSKYVTYPAIVRDMFANSEFCNSAQKMGFGHPNYPVRGDVFACGVCIPDVSDGDNVDTLKRGSYMFNCDKSGSSPSMTFQNYSDSACVYNRLSAPLKVSLGATADACLPTSSFANSGMDDDSSEFAYEHVTCLVSKRAPTAPPTTAPTSKFTVVKFTVVQSIIGLPFVDTLMAESAYKEAISGAIAEALSIATNSVKDLIIDPGTSRRRRLLDASLAQIATLFGYSPAFRNLRSLDATAPAAPSVSAGTEEEKGKNSVIITYLVDTNIGGMTLKGLKSLLQDSTESGTLDDLLNMWGSKNANTSALANVQISMPKFSNEYQAPAEQPPIGLPGYAIALIAISLAVVLCGSAYGAYYFHYRKKDGHSDTEHLTHDNYYASDNMPAEKVEVVAREAVAKQPKTTHGEENLEAFGMNPYAGQMRSAPRRMSTTGAVPAPAASERRPSGAIGAPAVDDL